MNQQPSDKSQILIFVSLCLLTCDMAVVKAGSLLPWKEDPEDGNDDCSLALGASSASLTCFASQAFWETMSTIPK